MARKLRRPHRMAIFLDEATVASLREKAQREFRDPGELAALLVMKGVGHDGTPPPVGGPGGGRGGDEGAEPTPISAAASIRGAKKAGALVALMALGSVVAPASAQAREPSYETVALPTELRWRRRKTGLLAPSGATANPTSISLRNERGAA